MQVDRRQRTVGEWLDSRPLATAPPEAFRWLASLLRSEGLELLTISPAGVGRGTPVYVEASACVLEVQRLMASNHIRSLPVLDSGEVIGFIDLVDLALTTDLTEDHG
jgi:predicted transcriptional regulator